MLWSGCLGEVKITKLDNGYVLEWEVKSPKRNAVPYDDDLRGKEIVEGKADLLMRIQQVI